MNWYIKERWNPQTGTYYVALGQQRESDIKRRGKSLYGENRYHSYKTEREYLQALLELKKQGKNIQDFPSST